MPQFTGRILLADGSSHLLLANGVDHALLSGGAAAVQGQLRLVNGINSLLYVNGIDHVLLMQTGSNENSEFSARRMVILAAENRDLIVVTEARQLTL